MSQSEKHLQIESPEGLPLGLSLVTPGSASDAAPLVVFLHGFKGFKDWGSWSWLSRRLADRHGLATLRVNFAHNGVAPHGQDFVHLDRFETDTWGKRWAELRSVLDWARTHGKDHGLDATRLGLVGHSLGGGLAVLAAAADPGVRAVATLAGVARALRFPPQAVEEIEQRGFLTILNARTGQEMRLRREWLDELRQQPERFDILAAAARLGGRPLLIIHAGNDEAVPADEAQQLFTAAGPSARLVVLQSGNHTLGTRHPPDATPSDPFPAVVDMVGEFLSEALA